MVNKIITFLLLLVVAGVAAFVYMSLIKEKSYSNEIMVDHSLTRKADELPSIEQIQIGEIQYEDSGEHHSFATASVSLSNFMPFSPKSLNFTIGASTGFDSKNSSLDDAILIFDREHQVIQIGYKDKPLKEDLAFVFKKDLDESLEVFIKNIVLNETKQNGSVLQIEGDEIEARISAIDKYCSLEIFESAGENVYRYLPLESYNTLSTDDVNNHGPNLCGVGKYYVFDDLVIKTTSSMGDGSRPSILSGTLLLVD